MLKNRREFLKLIAKGSIVITTPVLLNCGPQVEKRPNILICISDDQSWPHAGAYGCKFVNTPNFDRISHEGILFNNAYVSAPSCCPSRGSILTGQAFYRLERASMNHTRWSDKFKVYTDILAAADYHVGFTGKGWGPGNWKVTERKHNPAGQEYNNYKTEPTAKGMSNIDYARNFKDFIEKRADDQPICFWYGGYEPHRIYEKESGLKQGKKLEDVDVPSIYPDVEEIRSDLLDYALEIEWFDTHLGRMIKILEEINELDNTIIVVTSDNGMPYPRAKATVYDMGTHVPFALRWGNKVKSGRIVDDFISLTDLAPTFLEAAGLSIPNEVTGKSLMNILFSEKSGQIESDRDFVITGIERHFPGSREGSNCYPIRTIQTHQYSYIRNYESDRMPVGEINSKVWPDNDPTHGYADTDGSPTKTHLVNNRKTYPRLFELAFCIRPEVELYDIQKDPYQMFNLAEDSRYNTIKANLSRQLQIVLQKTQDPRQLGKGDLFEFYAKEYPGY